MNNFTFLKTSLLVIILLASNVNAHAANPVITVMPESVPGIAAYVGSTETETITVTGVGLTTDITLALTGDDASQFFITQTSIAQTAGAADAQLTISYNPQTGGSHTAILTFSSEGAVSVTRDLTGIAAWPPLDAPMATSATASHGGGFTANWESVAGATEYQLNVYTKTVCPELIVSEYVEGSSANRAIEVYNGTGKTVDLGTYSLKIQNNGIGSYTSEQFLEGSLVSGEVHVVVNSLAIPSILAVKDQTNDIITAFAGNDAIALFNNGILIDEVGLYNQAVDWGKNVTMTRKSSVVAPNTFVASEWDTQAMDYIANLGSHVMNIPATTGTRLNLVAGSPFTVTGSTSTAVSGLTAGTAYYYTVIAKSGVLSTASNEISAETLTTNLANTADLLKVSASDGKISFRAVAGEKVEVYNAIGQKILAKLTVDGMNTITLTARGVVLVKVGKRTTKVIL